VTPARFRTARRTRVTTPGEATTAGPCRLAAEVAKNVHIDTSRVFGSGYSGGAFFLNQITCRLPGIFKAFASHSGGAPYEQGNPPTWPNGCVKCTGNPTPAILLHGTSDNVVDPSGSQYAAACWATTDSCSNTDPTTWPATTPSPCVKDPACTVELCLVPGVGHTQWSQGMTVAWDFFKSVP
jgi:polyhydroxybutyrate depolymerase